MFKSMLIASASLLLISACTTEEVDTSESARPLYVKLASVTDVPSYTEFTFPAVVSAVKTVDLSFEVSGRLVQVDLVTGSDISEGKLLATIDRAPFIRRLEEQTTRMEQAKRELARIEKMFSQNLVAQSALDAAKTSYELAVIDVQNAEQDLSYTRLYAPFDAKVSERLVENNSFVGAGDAIARLQDVSKIYFNINVPERLLTANIGRGILSASATLATKRDVWFPVEYVEHNTQPDPVSQTYEAVFAMEPQKDLPLTPGARAVVRVNLNGNAYAEGMMIPIKALVGDDASGFNVWRYDESTQSVAQVAVSVNHIEGQFAIIQSELALGDQIVAAGASKMRKGTTVLPYNGDL